MIILVIQGYVSSNLGSPRVVGWLAEAVADIGWSRGWIVWKLAQASAGTEARVSWSRSRSRKRSKG